MMNFLSHSNKISQTILNLFLKKTCFFEPFILGGQRFTIASGVSGVIYDGIKSDMFNCLVNTNKAGFSPHTLKAIMKIYAAADLPFAIWFPDHHVNEKALQDAGLAYDALNIGMEASLDESIELLAPTHIEDYDVVRVTHAEQLSAFAQVIASLFNPMDCEVIRFYNRLATSNFNPLQSPVRLYVGYYRGQAVSTGSMYMDGKFCGIYDVATTESFRRRGFSGEIMKCIMMDAIDNEARFSYLQASPHGVSLYKKLGFKERCRIKTYTSQHC